MPQVKYPKTNDEAITQKPKKKEYESFRLQKAIKNPSTPSLPSGWSIFKRAIKLLWNNWKPFLGIAGIYMLLNLVLVQSVIGFDVNAAKENISASFGGGFNHILSSFSIFTALIGSTGSTKNDVASAYQFILVLIASLALIWTLRQVTSGKEVRVRDGFYKGMHPFIQFILVFGVIALQFIPVAIAAYLYGLAGPAGSTVNTVEWLLWIVGVSTVALVSVYLIASSVFALYIICLPGTEPMTALRSARELVRYRRWTVIRRLLFLPFILITLSAAILLPIILFVAPLAVVVFFFMSMLLLPLIHAYMYRLYRELLREDI